MISSSSDYKLSVFAPVRQVNSRATMVMNSFSQLAPLAWNWAIDYKGKITGSTTVNGNLAKATNGTTLASPSSAWVSPEFTQAQYDSVKSVDGNVRATTITISGYIGQLGFGFNIIRALEDKFGVNLWQGKTLLSDKIIIAKGIITKLTCNWYGYGTAPAVNGGNKASLARWDGTNWVSPISHTNSTVTNLTYTISSASISTSIDSTGFCWFIAYANASDGTTGSTCATDFVSLTFDVSQTTTRTFDDDTIVSLGIVEEVSTLNDASPSDELSLTMDNTSGMFSFMTLQSMHTIIASRPKIDIELGVVLSDGVTNEWIPMGSFYMDNWQIDQGAMTITFTAHDYLMILGNTSFAAQTFTNAYTLAQAIFANAGITKYDIDTSLQSYTGTMKSWTTNSRDLLQQIAILSQCTLYQDRYGVVQIQKFQTVDQSHQSISYVSSQAVMRGYAGANTYPLQSTEGGMKAISFNDMYAIPQVTLDTSIYQLNINVYSTSGTNPVLYTYTNSAINGNNGQSFSIDIPLITTKAQADAISAWFFEESNYNAVYVVDWRQNPVLMATDVIIIDDSSQSAKQTRVYKQEYHYEGYLSGTTESRGGI
jgi:hypothetical protein